MYHSIGETVPSGFRPFVVRPERFRAQLQALAGAGHELLSVSELVRRRRAGRPPKRAAILTFDDGFADFLRNALPILQVTGMTATLYVTSGLVGGHFHGLAMLTWPDLREIQQAGIEIGGHTVSHPALDQLSAAACRQEVIACKRQLEDRLGVEVRSFAYPFGFYNQQARAQVIGAGYKSACAVRYGFSPQDDDEYALRRSIVRNGDTRLDRPPVATPYYRSRSILYGWMRHTLRGWEQS